ncbi:MAG: class I SAM-dependent methyltransferase [Vicinamibacterales bacterium]
MNSSTDRNPIALNRANWDSRVPIHAKGYDLHRYREDERHLSPVVRFDRPRLGEVTGLTTVHLQCHLGTDTLSLARLGARMTGLDFSAPALDVARRLAADCGASIDYVLADVHDAVDALGAGRFDLVYTGVGAICWLPDIRRWARTVAALLRPGGRLFMREGHPMLWTLADPRPDGLLVVEFPYFNVKEGTAFVESKTYVEHDGELASPESIVFNHALSEIFNAVWEAGLRVEGFEEHRTVPWNPLGDAMQLDETAGEGEWALVEGRDRLPASYTLWAVKPR